MGYLESYSRFLKVNLSECHDFSVDKRTTKMLTYPKDVASSHIYEVYQPALI
jgi:hypothetical protein